jgi:hypothetical protein
MPMPSVATLIVPTPIQDSEYSMNKPRDAIKEDVNKPMTTVSTPIIPTPTQDSEWSK